MVATYQTTIAYFSLSSQHGDAFEIIFHDAFRHETASVMGLGVCKYRLRGESLCYDACRSHNGTRSFTWHCPGI